MVDVKHAAFYEVFGFERDVETLDGKVLLVRKL